MMGFGNDEGIQTGPSSRQSNYVWRGPAKSVTHSVTSTEAERMTSDDITLSREDAGQIKDVLSALHYLLTSDNLAQSVAQRISDGPFGSTFGVEAARSITM